MFNEEDNRDSFEYHEIYGKKQLLQKKEAQKDTESWSWCSCLSCCWCFT